jgi:chromosome partitioning protein
VIIVYCSEKGGSGKTTLAVEHAIWAFDRGRRVAVIDADRQFQAGHWLSKAEPQILVRQITGAGQAKAALTSLRKSHELVVVDVPAKLEKESIVILDAADVAVVPVMASPLDMRSAMVWSKNVLAAILRRHPGRPVVRFVINGLDMRTIVAREVLDFARRMNPPAAASHVRRLAEFVNAADNTSVTRMGYTARRGRADCERLFREVMELADDTTDAGRSKRRAANE